MTESFIKRIAETTTQWQPEEYTELNDPSWEQYFSKGDVATKQNLTRAWFWCLYLNTVDLEETEFNNYCENVVLRQFKFIAQLKPYMDSSCRVPKRYADSPYALTNMLRIAEETEEYYPEPVELVRNEFRMLWLGSPEERLSKLLQDLPWKELYSGPWVALVPHLYADVLNLAGATDEHVHRAMYLSFGAGVNHHVPNEQTPSKLLPWIKLGNQHKYVARTVPEEEIASYRETLDVEVPSVTVNVAKYILHSSMYNVSKTHSAAHAATLLGVLSGTEPQTDFERMSKLLPRYAGAWSVCESMGMTLDAACAHIESLPTSVRTSCDLDKLDIIS